jgi:hypothetical protein
MLVGRLDFCLVVFLRITFYTIACVIVPHARYGKMKPTMVRWIKGLRRPSLVSALILGFGLLPLFYEEALLGRKLPASFEMLYTLIIIHVSLFLIRAK